MTTKYKITTGFVFMVLLLMGLAFVGYSTLDKMTGGFANYRRLAYLNTATSDLDTAANVAAFGIYRFLDTHDPKEMAKTRQALDAATKQIEACKQRTHSQTAKEMTAALEKNTQNIRKLADALETETMEAYKRYADVVLPAVAELTKELDSMTAQASGVNNTQVLADIITAWNHLAAGRAALGRFAESRSLEYTAIFRDNFAKASQDMKKMEADLRTESGRQTHKSLMAAFVKVNDGVTAMEARYNNVATQLKEVEANLTATLQTSKKFSDYQMNNMEKFGTEMMGVIADSQQFMLAGSVGGVLLGLAFALVIIYGIMRALRETGHFATAIARGDFTHAINVKEGGEIGEMVDALRQIPTVLARLVAEADALTADVLGGRFRHRLDTAAFPGSYGELTKAVNLVGDAYTNVIDGLGIPIMCCDAKRNILYLSPAAQQVAGDCVSKLCSDELKTDLCPGDGCFGKRAMTQGVAVHGETTIRPRGRVVEVDVIASHLKNQGREVIGFMTVLTDLTEIKSKQALIMQVARDAGEIAGRVAAASEELAAQVEQVSRGAEVQRERVETTASAMTEMNSTVLEVARNAGQASEQSENTRCKADEGAQLVNKVVRSINDVNTVALALQNNMTELGHQAESIGGVMNVISDIADQTNLLALNAAIEAARAGEAGRGFAVVADEVRKLAEKTMEATKEVGSNIQAIQQSARTNIGEVTNAVKNIGQATELANASGQALQEIVALASANSGVVASIAAAAEEQSATSEEINRAIDEINRVAAETSGGMVQSSSAVHDLSEQAQGLNRVMQGLK